MKTTDESLATHQLLVMLMAYVVTETARPLMMQQERDELRRAIGASMANMLWVARHRTGSRWMLPTALQSLVDKVLNIHQPSDSTIAEHPAGGLNPTAPVTMAQIEVVRAALERHGVHFELAGLHEFVRDFVARAEAAEAATSGEEWLALVDACAKIWKAKT